MRRGGKKGMTWTLSERTNRILKNIPEEWGRCGCTEAIDENTSVQSPSQKPYRCTSIPLHGSPPKSRIMTCNFRLGQDAISPMIITSVDEPVSQVEELSRNVHYLLRESGIKGKEAKVLKTEMKKLVKRMGSWDNDFKNEWLYTCKIEKKLCEVEDKVEKKEKEKVEMKKYITELERMKECMEEMKGKWELMDYKLGWYDMDERSNDAIDVLKTYGTTPPPGLQDPSNDP
ncbi:hypothetical protein Tco_0003845 [Tanacetum coccineum]